MNSFVITVWTIICIIITAILFLNLIWVTQTSTQTITISGKSLRVSAFGSENGGGATSTYLIHTKSGEVLANQNSLIYRKFTSDELQGKLKIGKTYRIKTCGFRVPILGMYKNILSATEIKQKKK